MKLYIHIIYIIVSVSVYLLFDNNVFAYTKQDSVKLYSDSKVDLTLYDLYKSQKHTDYETAINTAQTFLSRVDSSIHNPILAETAMELSKYYLEKKFFFTESIKWGEYAYNIYKHLGNERQMADIQLYLAPIYIKKSKYHKALLSLHEAVRISRKTNDSLKLTECYNISGNLKTENEDMEGARKDFEKYIKGARHYRDTVMIIKGLNNLALISLRDTSMDRSIIFFEEAMSLAKKIQDTSLLFKTNISMITTYMSSAENFDKAGKELKDIYKYTTNIEEKGTYHWINGWFLTLGKNFIQAAENIEKALYYFEQGEFELQTLSCYFLLGEIYHNLGYDDKAYYALNDYCKLFRFNNNREELIKLFKLQNDILIEQERLQMEEKKMKQQNVFLISIFVFIIIAILLVSFYIQKNLKLQKKEAILAAMETEKARKEQELKSKNELVEMKRMQQFQSEKLIMDIIDKLHKLNLTIKEKHVRDEISLICHDLKNINEDPEWEEEVKQFIPEFNSSFFQKLSAEYPDLSINQKRLCILLNMNMTTKMISEITRQSPHSINISRSRLRKKFGLSSKDISIQEFLSKYN